MKTCLIIAVIKKTTKAVVKFKPENKFRPEWDEFFSGFNFTIASCVYNCDDQSFHCLSNNFI